MRLPIWILAAIVTMGLAGCEDTKQYPLSGEQCGPTDPVLTLDANTCLPALPGL